MNSFKLIRRALTYVYRRHGMQGFAVINKTSVYELMDMLYQKHLTRHRVRTLLLIEMVAIAPVVVKPYRRLPSLIIVAALCLIAVGVKLLILYYHG